MPSAHTLNQPHHRAHFLQVYKNVTDFTARELANLMWALAILDHRPAWILDCVLGHAMDNLASYSPNSLHLLVWSLAKLGHQPSEVRPGGEGEPFQRGA